MRLDPHPLFRRIIIPWYDSPPVYFILLPAMVVLIIFSITGIIVAQYNPDYNGFVWIPIVLLLLSLFMVFSLAYRMIQRANQQKEE